MFNCKICTYKTANRMQFLDHMGRCENTSHDVLDLNLGTEKSNSKDTSIVVECSETNQDVPDDQTSHWLPKKFYKNSFDVNELSALLHDKNEQPSPASSNSPEKEHPSIINNKSLVPYSDSEAEAQPSPTNEHCREEFIDTIEFEKEFFPNSLEEYTDVQCDSESSWKVSDNENEENVHNENGTPMNNLADDSSFTGSPSKEEITILKNNNVGKQRIYDKKDACLYCGKIFSKIIEHLSLVHSEEMEVNKFLALDKRSKERRLALQNIRNKGNFLHNKNVFKNKKGVILAKRRPMSCYETNAYLPCDICLGFYKKTNLGRHHRKCAKKNSQPEVNARTNAVTRGSVLLLDHEGGISEKLESILKHMKHDQVSLVVRNDDLIKQFGNSLCDHNFGLVHADNDISQKMRELARLLIEIQNKNHDIKNLKEALVPHHFKMLIQSVKRLCNLDYDTSRKPTLALKLGFSLQKCVGIMKTEAIMMCKETKIKEADYFLHLYNQNWANSISRRALGVIEEGKFNKPSPLPLAKDVKKLNKYITFEENKAFHNIMSQNASEKDFKALCQITLVHLITFNRKRVGEVERLTKAVYLKKVFNAPKQEEIYDSLTAIEKQLVKHMSLIYIRGKTGKQVPLLMTPTMVKHVDTIILKQNDFQIPPDNKYIFACPNGKFPYRASDALRFAAFNCGAEKPENLTSTRLRKHIATISQILNLSKTDFEQLTKHLGHSRSVHESYYRLPDPTLQLARMTTLLLKFEKGEYNPDQSFEDILPGVATDSSDDEETERQINCAVEPQQHEKKTIPNKKRTAIEDSLNKESFEPESQLQDQELVLPTSERKLKRRFCSKLRKSTRTTTTSNTSSEESSDDLCNEELSLNCSKRQNRGKGSNTSQKPSRNTQTTKKETKRNTNKSKVTWSYRTSNKTRAVNKEMWSAEETTAVESFFQKNIILKRVPNKKECEQCIAQNHSLKSRSWVTVKSKVYNMITANKRKVARYDD